MPTTGNISPIVGMARLNNGASGAECNRRTPRRRNRQTSARTSFGRTSTDLCSKNSGRASAMNPYLGYGTSPKLFLYNGDIPKGIKPLAYVLAVGDDAWSLDLIKRNKRIDAGDLVITCASGQKSALYNSYNAEGRDIRNVVVQRHIPKGLVDAVHDLTFAFVFHAFKKGGTLYK